MKNLVQMIRGDSVNLYFSIEDSNSLDGKYRLTDADIVYFGVMLPHQKFENALIKKVLRKENQDEYGDFLLKILPEDTVDMLPGVYYYEIKLRKNAKTDSEEVMTVVNKVKFIIHD